MRPSLQAQRQLQSHEVLIEGYVLTRSGRPIQSVAVYPGALNQLSETIPGALAVTDSNGFFSIVVDRQRLSNGNWPGGSPEAAAIRLLLVDLDEHSWFDHVE